MQKDFEHSDNIVRTLSSGKRQAVQMHHVLTEAYLHAPAAVAQSPIWDVHPSH